MTRTGLLLAALTFILPRVAPSAEEGGEAAPPPAPAPLSLETEQAKMSYILGLDSGNYVKRMQESMGVEADLEVFLRALNDALSGAKPLLSDEEITQFKQESGKKIQARRAELRAQLAEKNEKEGAEFLAENAKKEGVVTTESGLQYMVVKEGTGPRPQKDDSVEVNYRGSLIDGSEFDSSYKRGSPATFEVGRVVKGWTEGLQLMPVGSTYRFFIPSGLGYGERGKGDQIGPSAVLIFEVELLGIKAEPLGPQPPRRSLPRPKSPGR